MHACIMITTIRLAYYLHHLITIFHVLEHIRSALFATFRYRSHYAVHHIPRTYSPYNWTFIFFDHYLPIFPAPQTPITPYLRRASFAPSLPGMSIPPSQGHMPTSRCPHSILNLIPRAFKPGLPMSDSSCSALWSTSGIQLIQMILFLDLS